jgi:hypothetical protein
MSQDFVKVNVVDSRLNVTDAISYAVSTGAQNMTAQSFNAISQTPSAISFSIQIPSEQTIIDRRLMWQSTVMLRLVVTTPAGVNPLNV